MSMPAKRPSDASVGTATKMVRLNSGPIPVAAGVVKISKTLTIVSSKGVDNSADALLDRSQRFVTTG
eukprot:CAMPEP_0173125040 /NCGR_PEP_ID=MMETSP1102-20130122/56108_1 /TAXON_ID=49646 /ORGANISM="Geminigera sp., Strain Caron Lab Isolate" /LENGTH=66 /DNA_ID=CAMNT_0014033689 /DNA_START=52 /DNA_END=248 /DNA_ORIENTATION=-